MSLRLTGDWPTVRQLFNARGFQRRYKLNLQKFLKTTGIAVVGLMTKVVLRESPFAGNAALTVAMKGSDVPLVDNNDMVQSFAWEIKGDEVFSGVKRGAANFNVAAIVHEGATINVTKKMRGFFLFLHSQNSEILPLSPKTRRIIIPGRPFAQATHDDSRLRPFVDRQGKTLIMNALNPKADMPFKSSV